MSNQRTHTASRAMLTALVAVTAAQSPVLADVPGVKALIEQAVYWKSKGRQDLADQALRRALALDPGNAQARQLANGAAPQPAAAPAPAPAVAPAAQASAAPAPAAAEPAPHQSRRAARLERAAKGRALAEARAKARRRALRYARRHHLSRAVAMQLAAEAAARVGTSARAEAAAPAGAVPGPAAAGPVLAQVNATSATVTPVASNAPRVTDTAGDERMQGFDSLNADNLDGAAVHFQRALSRNRNDPDALGGMGIVRLRQSRFGEARDLLDRASRLGGSDKWAEALGSARFFAGLEDARTALQRGQLDAAQTTAEGLARSGYKDVEPALELLADIYERQGRYADAADFYRQAGESGGAQTESRLESRAARGRALAAAERGDDVTAEQEFQNGLLIDHDDPWIRYEFARFLIKRGRGIEAESLLASLSQSNDADSLYAAALVNSDLGRAGAAEGLLERVPEAKRSPAMRSFAIGIKTDSAIERARQLASNGQRPEAVAALRQIGMVQNLPADRRAAIAGTLYDLGDNAGAVQFAMQAVSGKITEVDAYDPLVRVLAKTGRDDLARAALQKASQLAGNSPQGQQAVARMGAGMAVAQADRLRTAGQFASAFDVLRAAWGRAQDNVDVLMALGRLYQTGRLPARAAQTYQLVLARDARNKDALLGLADAADAAADKDLSNKAVDRALKLYPEDYDVRLRLAELYQNRGNRTVAMRMLREARGLYAKQFGLPAGATFGGNPFAAQQAMNAPLQNNNGNPFRNQPGAAAPAQVINPFALGNSTRLPGPGSYNSAGAALQLQSYAPLPESSFGNEAYGDRNAGFDPVQPLPQAAAPTTVARYAPANGAAPQYRDPLAYAAPVARGRSYGEAYPATPTYAPAPSYPAPAYPAPAPSYSANPGYAANSYPAAPVYAPVPTYPAPTYANPGYPAAPARTPAYGANGYAAANPGSVDITGAPDSISTSATPVPYGPTPYGQTVGGLPPYVDPTTVNPFGPQPDAVSYAPQPASPTAVAFAAGLSSDPVMARIENDIQHLDSQQGPAVSGIVGFRARSGETGLSSMNSIRGAVEISTSAGSGKFYARATPELIDAGTPTDDGNGNSPLARFGRNPTPAAQILAQPKANAALFNAEAQSYAGIATEVGYQGKTVQANIGTAPLGNFGGVRVPFHVGVTPKLSSTTQLQAYVERRPVTDSVVSYAGTRDPVSGDRWGQVQRTGGGFGMSYDKDETGFYASAGWNHYHGLNVANNNAIETNFGGYIRVYKGENSSVVAGLNVNFQNFKNPQNFFSFGHGGYFSPQSFLAVGFPIRYHLRHEDLEVHATVTPGFQSYKQDAVAVYPTLKAQQAILDSLFLLNRQVLSKYPSLSNTGFAIAAEGAVEYQIAPNTRLSGEASVNTFGSYNEFRSSFGIRQSIGASK